MQAKIEKNLSVGASLKDIQDYLDTKGKSDGIQHYPDEGLDHASDYSVLQDMGVPPETPVYAALLPRESSGFNIYFLLDKDLRFQRVLIFEYHTGP